MQKSHSWTRLKCLLFAIACVFLVGTDTVEVKGGTPVFQGTSHKRNRLRLGAWNSGSFGGGFINYPGVIDVFTGETRWIGSEFPVGSQLQHLESGSFWIGALLGGDTLVSSGGHDIKLEWNPDEAPFGYILHRSTINPDASEFEEAVSEEDYIAVYTDTFKTSQLSWVGYDEIGLRPHKPLNIEITEASYAWSFDYAEDFILYDLKIKNIGEDNLRNLYFGINMLPEVGWIGGESISFDDICGYMKSYKTKNECGFVDTLNMAWLADNDGDPYQGEFLETASPYKASRHAMGVSFIGLPAGEIKYSFNWWNHLYASFPSYFDFGPRHRDNFRNFGTGGLGRPAGDRNMYHMLSNGEIDYDMPLTGTIKQYDLAWMYPDSRLQLDVSDGFTNMFLYSVGPFNLSSGSTIPIVFVIAAGENLHTNPRNLENIYRGDIDTYYANLDFSDLIKNVQWARSIYDNPGIDTDNDGYAGEFRVCVFDSVLDANSNWIATVAETTWYKGDGVPDWRAAVPPPAPKMWLTPTFKGINIRFNGQESETTPDIFTKLLDFEGYRIYIARDDRETSYSLIASYDIENYDKFIWNYEKQPEAGWELLDFPMSLREIRCAYGSTSLTTGATACDDSLFDFLRFRPSFPYSPPNFPESLFYFVKHEHNVAEFGVTTPITKRFPNATDPRGLPLDSITTDFYTDDGYLKFFEYEFIIENIIPTVVYYVSVTAMDFGWPKSGLEPLETSITENARQVYASVVDPAVGADSLQIVVYPNPYRIDADYRARGFEGLNQDDRWSERVRRIHFANIPPKCTISIFSLDGDLVREIRHDKDPSDPTSRHAEWGLISRNGLRVVSGLYYWVVESDSRTEMGKLVIIM